MIFSRFLVHTYFKNENYPITPIFCHFIPFLNLSFLFADVVIMFVDMFVNGVKYLFSLTDKEKSKDKSTKFSKWLDSVVKWYYNSK